LRLSKFLPIYPYPVIIDLFPFSFLAQVT